MKWRDFLIFASRILSVVVIAVLSLGMFKRAITKLDYAFAIVLTFTLIHFWKYLFFKKSQ